MLKIIKSHLKRFKPHYLFLRGFFIQVNMKNRKLKNLYFLTMQKSGSQWVRQIFNDRRLKSKTKLLEYPQHRYELNEFHQKFPIGTFVPGLYMSYDLYEEIKKPTQYKTICIIRDPRDIVISWYFSMLKTHKLMGKVGKYRSVLKEKSFDDGIHYCIDELSIKFMAMRTWINNSDDDNMIFIKFEDLVHKSKDTFTKIFMKCGINISEQEIENILNEYSKDRMRKKDLATRKDKSESHYRKKSSKHVDYFKEEHYKHFYNVTGNLIDILGYKRN
jgi:hypothetical protein